MTPAPAHPIIPTNVRSRLLAILLFAYQAVFLNVAVPGHTRGAITLDGRHPGSATTAVAGGSRCCPPRTPGHSRDQAPSPADRANCAVCHLAAHYTPPPVTDLRPLVLGLADTLPPHAPEVATTPTPPLSYFGRAPPALA